MMRPAISTQLVATGLDEEALVRASTAFQGVTSWHRRRPACLVHTSTVSWRQQ
jgi:hypothetical protein